MKAIYKIGAIILTLALVFSLAACTKTPEPAPAAPAADSGAAAPAAAPAAEAAPAPAQNYNLTLGTAGTTGTYYVVGAAIANAVTANNPNLNVVAQATNGGVENLSLIHI